MEAAEGVSVCGVATAEFEVEGGEFADWAIRCRLARDEEELGGAPRFDIAAVQFA